MYTYQDSRKGTWASVVALVIVAIVGFAITPPCQAGLNPSSDISEIFSKLHVVDSRDNETTQAGYDDAWLVGMRGFRPSLLWDHLEPTQDAPLPSWPWDDHITPWRDRGGWVYCEISGFPPQWAQDLGVTQNPPTEAGLVEWEEFVTACVNRNISLYGTSSQGGIEGYIIFTEPNSGWEPATFESKTIVIERGAAAIRALDPGAKVVLEGPWGVYGAAQGANRVILASGGVDDLDEIGIHPFATNNMIAMPEKDGTKGAVISTSAIAKQYGLPSTGVILSEMAYTSYNTTEDNQANGWTRCMALLLSSETVPMLTWAYDWWDCATNLGDDWRLTGARNSSGGNCWSTAGTKKQVWDAVDTFVNLLGGSEYVGELALSSTNYGFQFRNKTSPYTMTTVLWNSDTTDNVTLSTPAGSLTKYTRQGSSSTIYPSSGQITAGTSESPIYLVGEIDEDEWATVDTLARSINILGRSAPAANKDIWQIRYQTDADITNGTLTIDIPSGWVAPQVTNSGVEGYVSAEGTASVTLGAVSVNGLQISVPITSAKAGDRVTVTYGDARDSSHLYDGGSSNYNLDYYPMCGNMKYLDPASYTYGKGDGFTVTGIAGANKIQTANPREIIYRDVAVVYNKTGTTFQVLVDGATNYQVIVYLDPINASDEYCDQTITVNGDGPYDSYQDRRFASVTPDGGNFVKIDMLGDTSNSQGVPVNYFFGVEMIPVGLGGGPTSSASNGENAFVVKLDGATITDGDQTITVTGGAANQPPVANDQSDSTNEDTALPITLSYSDPDGPGPYTFSVVSGPSNGSLDSPSTSPDWTYTPNVNYNGPDSFTWNVNDGLADSNTATFSITVTAINDAPVFTQDPMSRSDTCVDAAYSDTIAGSATDPDNDPLTYSKVSGPAWLNVAADGALSGTPGASDTGANSWTVQVDDGNGGSDTATLNIYVKDIPASPTNLAATPAGQYQIDLTWTDNSNNEDQFHIIRKIEGGAYDWEVYVGANVTSYSDTSVDCGTTYRYGIQAVNSCGVSTPYNVSSSVATDDCDGPTVHYPSSYTVTTGSYQSGDLNSLTVDDDDYLTVNSASGFYTYTFVDFDVTGVPTSTPSQIDVEVIRKSSASSTTAKIYLYNYSSSAWDEKDSFLMDTNEATRTVTVTSGAANYVSGDTLKVRCKTGKAWWQAYTVYFELVEVTVTP
ncbi:MAG: hypothetical protein GWP08_10145 [Nitrospiraceae bacterium]|nr:hypothetical protein [Nitrospiraceae bacterium]